MPQVKAPKSAKSAGEQIARFSIETANQGCQTLKTLSHHYKVIQSD